MATLAAGSARPPDSAARALPGARYSAPKITKLATSRLPISIASRRTRNRTVLSLLPAEVVRPRREHVGERADSAAEAVVHHQDVRRLCVGYPRELLGGQLLGLGDEPGPRVQVGGAACLPEQRRDLRIAEVVIVLRPA